MPDQAYSTIAVTGGTAIIEITTGSRRNLWKVTQISLDAPTASGLAKIKKNGSQVTPTIAANGVASGEPPVELLPGDKLTIEWSGLTVGALVKALVFYDEISL